MSFLIWLLGWTMIAIGVKIFHIMFKRVVWPYNRFVFDNSNEHGIVALATWEDKVAFDKFKAKKEFMEGLYGLPAIAITFVGIMCVIITTGEFLLN